MKKAARTTPLRIFFYTLLIFILVAPVACQEDKDGGVGLRVAQLYDPQAANKMGSLVVLDVFPDKASEHAGVQRGDIIIKIDEKKTRGRQFDDLIKTGMLGPLGSRVKLTIKRAGTDETLIMILKREAL